MLRTLLVTAPLLLAADAALGEEAQSAPAADASATASATEALPAPLPPETVVARRGGVELTLADLDAQIALAPGSPAHFTASKERVLNLIEALLLNRQLAAMAREAGKDQDPQVQRQIQLATEKVLGEHALRLAVERAGAPDFELLARESYQANRAKYRTPAVHRVRHLLVGFEKRSREEARAEALRLRDLARQPGTDFIQLLMEHSDDPSKAQNNGLFVVEEGNTRYEEAFTVGALRLKRPGEVSDLVETRYGFHVLQLLDYTPPRQRSFEEVKAQMVADIRANFVRKVENDTMSALRAAKPEFDDAVIDTMQTRYGLPGPVPNPAEAPR